MKKSYNTLNRRQFIGHTASGLAATSLANAFTQRALAQETQFKRCIIWHVPEGATQTAFWPRDFGELVINANAKLGTPKSQSRSITDYRIAEQAGYCLQPLTPHINDMSLYSGFKSIGDTHVKVTANTLTGAVPKEGSLDQILARRMKGNSPLESAYFAVYGHHANDSGASNGFYSPARRIGGGTFGSANWNPMDEHKRIFANGVPEPSGGGNTQPMDYNPDTLGRLSVLQSLESRLKQVACEGGDDARRKLEALLESYQKLEADTQSLIDAESDNNNNNNADVRFDIPNGWLKTDGNRKGNYYWNKPENFTKLVKIAIDSTVAALALDRTRMSLLQFGATGNQNGPAPRTLYGHLGIDMETKGENLYDHHWGHGHEEYKRRDQGRLFRWYYGQLAYLIDRLKAIPDGAGSLFDSTLIVTSSCFSMYGHHNMDMPYILFGGSDIKFRKKHYGDARQNGQQRPAPDFHLGIANVLGENLGKFGTSTNAFNLG